MPALSFSGIVASCCLAASSPLWVVLAPRPRPLRRGWNRSAYGHVLPGDHRRADAGFVGGGPQALPRVAQPSGRADGAHDRDLGPGASLHARVPIWRTGNAALGGLHGPLHGRCDGGRGPAATPTNSHLGPAWSPV